MNQYKPTANHYTTIGDLTLTCADSDIHAKTCDYWYLVRSCVTAHTAFNNRSSLIKWMDERGLTLMGELPEHGTRKFIYIAGKYRQTMHHSHDDFFAIRDKAAVVTRTLSNGDWTMALITIGSDGIRTVHTLNPNCRNRPIYDQAESRALMG